VLSAIELSRKTHRECAESKPSGERQRPHANSDLARRAETAADSETGNRRPGVVRSTARLGHIVGIAPEQHLPLSHRPDSGFNQQALCQPIEAERR